MQFNVRRDVTSPADTASLNKPVRQNRSYRVLRLNFCVSSKATTSVRNSNTFQVFMLTKTHKNNCPAKRDKTSLCQLNHTKCGRISNFWSFIARQSRQKRRTCRLHRVLLSQNKKVEVIENHRGDVTPGNTEWPLHPSTRPGFDPGFIYVFL
jgi:hypothetical protein